MAEGYDGIELIKVLQKYLPDKSTILELRMSLDRMNFFYGLERFGKFTKFLSFFFDR